MSDVKLPTTADEWEKLTGMRSSAVYACEESIGWRSTWATGIDFPHRCARCQHAFTSKADGFVDEALESEIAAHHERCFVVGDWVRLDISGQRFANAWQEGRIEALNDKCDGYSSVRISACGGDMKAALGEIRSLWTASLVRIPQPARNVRFVQAECLAFVAESKAAGFHATDCAYYVSVDSDCTYDERFIPAATPAPTLYDGMPEIDCYLKWCDNRSIVDRGGLPPYDLTPAQIAAGRSAYLAGDGVHRAGLLRARIAAARERDRLTVLVDDAE